MADDEGMSTPGIRLHLRPRGRSKPQRSPRLRPRIVDVTNHWRVRPDGNLRGVIVRDTDGALVTAYLPDSHPALVRYLDRLHAAA